MTSRRHVIAGVPRAGKTTYAAGLPKPVKHSDDLIEQFKWSEVSQHIADHWLTEPGPWVIEGVAAVRALRKFMVQHPDRKPCDRVTFLNQPRVPLTLGQQRMAKGCRTVWAQIRDELIKRGVEVSEW